MKKAIYINFALHEIRIATEPVILKYVRATGKQKGTITHIRCRYGYAKGKVKTAVDSQTKPLPTGTADRNKTHGLLPVIDIDTRQTRTLRIANIIGFNDYIVKH